ncbi:MAG: DNA translocase FtsK, partial [Clostridia bacterium]|nr:DNA translocase FtsK [Clostridia bacterium]
MENSKKKKTSGSAPPKARRTVKRTEEPKKENRAYLAFMPFVLGLVGLFLAACLLFPDVTGIVGRWLGEVLLGWFSLGAFAIPVVMFVRAFMLKNDSASGRTAFKWIISILAVILLGAFLCVFYELPGKFDLSRLYELGVSRKGGGIVSGSLAMLTVGAIGKVASGAVTMILFIVCGALAIGRSPSKMFETAGELAAEKITDARDNVRDRRIARREERERRREAAMRLLEENPADDPGVQRIVGRRKKKFNVDVEGKGESLPPPADPENGKLPEFELARPAEAQSAPEVEVPAEKETKKPDPAEAVDVLTDVFSRPEDPSLTERFSEEDPENSGSEAQISIKVSRSPVGASEKEKAPDPSEPVYHFPPLSLLKFEPVKKSVNPAEQEQTAKKLVETLSSFGVRTRILNIATGPTVTRYELQPDAGVRVRSIVNLSDDIALGLAASGVRIEAPIPGKEAVGIEIPNKTVATVYLRELLENPEFTNAESKLTACLGMDVAGKPMFCNIAKMPHLLIAGATNMGKSVCMNSIISSILYKASPDEVKLILIDPKKVEMSVYNGIPHLIVPTVSEPKKAAGALAWAVNEMERRFALMEETGARNIAGYNKVAENDPELKVEPLILIVIDELADLMMTARDEVETSICRLAQKARAAGIHLVIGTQRPSGDVITGLIKANFPSRIAFTVSSQVDSRTIIDTVGAERLIGRGDMLYAPVGST